MSLTAGNHIEIIGNLTLLEDEGALVGLISSNCSAARRSSLSLKSLNDTFCRILMRSSTSCSKTTAWRSMAIFSWFYS